MNERRGEETESETRESTPLSGLMPSKVLSLSIDKLLIGRGNPGVASDGTKTESERCDKNRKFPDSDKLKVEIKRNSTEVRYSGGNKRECWEYRSCTS